MNNLNIKPISNSIFLGKTHSGKTHTFKYIFKKIAHNYDYGVCFNSTADLNNDYDFIPSKYVHTEYDEDIILNIIDIQTKEIRDKGKKNAKKCFIIIDDSIGMLNFHSSNIWDGLVSKSRHLNMGIFIIIQHAKALTPCIRINTSYLFITKVSDNNIETCYDMSSGFVSKKAFKQYLDKWCNNYNCVLIDNLNVYESKPKVFKAPKEIKQFKLKY